MSGMASRLAGLLVREPVGGTDVRPRLVAVRPPDAPAAGAPLVSVLGNGAGLGFAAVFAERLAPQATATLLIRWAPGGVRAMRARTPSRAAVRLAAGVAVAGLAGDARGRLVDVVLDGCEHEAAARITLLRGIHDGPIVVALCGPWGPSLERVIAEGHLAVLAPAANSAPGLAELARHGVAQLGVPVLVADLKGGPLPPRLRHRAALGAALRALA